LFAFVRKGGTLISSVSVPDAQLAQQCGIEAKFILVDVNTEDLEAVADGTDVCSCAGFRTPARRALDVLMRPASEKRQGTKLRWVGHPAGQRALWGFGRVVRASAI
jgi:hypothetical protein